jgi:hypothetical protein
MYLCANDMLAIRSLVDTLRIPNMDTREIILDMFFEVLNIKPVEWYRAFLEGRRLTSGFSSIVLSQSTENSAVYGRQRNVPGEVSERIEDNVESDRLTLVDQYLALVLAVLTEAGLLDVSRYTQYSCRS